MRRKKLLISAAIVFSMSAIAGGIYYFSMDQGDGDNLAASQTHALPKEWLMQYFGTDDENDVRVGGAAGDPDDDILTNLQEYLYGSDPTKEDTDGDGDIDSYEVAYGQNPNGDDMLVATAQTKDYIKELIEGNPEYSEFSEQNISNLVNSVVKPGAAATLDLPEDRELLISSVNGPKAFEQYFLDTKDFMASADDDYQNLISRLFVDMSDEEIDSYIEKLRATEDVLKKVSVPSQIVNIQKLKIAGLRAGVSMLELVRDRYSPENESQEFWTEMFNKILAVQTIGTMEMSAWSELGGLLNDTGGWDEIK